MIEIALYQPEIPANTGNIIRLCHNMGAKLHLIHPLGFQLDSKQVKRAGLDYHDESMRIIHKHFEAFLGATQGQRLIACSTKARTRHSDFSYQSNDILLFGPETRGLPLEVIQSHPAVTIPMAPNSRSLNLSNSVAIIAFEAWRQLQFCGAK